MPEIIQSKTFDEHLKRVNEKRDILKEMLNHRRSLNTKISYETDIRDFFDFFGYQPSSETIKIF